MDRKQQLRSLVNERGLGLEISPSHSPVFPKALGYNIEVADHYTKAELLDKYNELDVACDAIEEVDYPLHGQALEDVIPSDRKYDYIFSSHVIEHVPDLLSHLRSCERLLKPAGVLVLAVPDKRYTFDILQQASTTGQVLEAFHRRRQRHGAAAVYDFVANYANLSDASVWGKGFVGEVATLNDVEGAHALLVDSLTETGSYHDVHGWFFTPSSFRLILHDVRALGLLGLNEASMHVVDALEFWVTLSADAPGHGLSRLQLHKEAAGEMAAAVSALLPAPPSPPPHTAAPRLRQLSGLRRWWPRAN